MSRPAVRVSLALQDIAAALSASLKDAAGETVPFVLALQVDGVAQYVSNTTRPDGMQPLQDLLDRWKARRAYIPAHYNPDLRAADPPDHHAV